MKGKTVNKGIPVYNIFLERKMAFCQHNNTLIWKLGQETIQLEPWGRDSLRIRGTTNRSIHNDLPGALLETPLLRSEIKIESEWATIRNGRISAHISDKGTICFLNNVSGEEVLAEKSQIPPAKKPLQIGWWRSTACRTTVQSI